MSTHTRLLHIQISCAGAVYIRILPLLACDVINKNYIEIAIGRHASQQVVHLHLIAGPFVIVAGAFHVVC